MKGRHVRGNRFAREQRATGALCWLRLFIVSVTFRLPGQMRRQWKKRGGVPGRRAAKGTRIPGIRPGRMPLLIDQVREAGLARPAGPSDPG